MPRAFDYIYPEVWLACPAKHWATPQQFALICPFGKPLPGFWLAIACSLLFLAFTIIQRCCVQDAAFFKHRTSPAMQPASEEYRRSLRSIVFGAPAVLVPLVIGMYMTAYITSATGWRWMIMGVPATAPRFISLAYPMSLVHLLCCLRESDKHLVLSPPLVTLKTEAAKAFRTSGWLITGQTALYLVLLYAPCARCCFQSGLVSFFQLLGMPDA